MLSLVSNEVNGTCFPPDYTDPMLYEAGEILASVLMLASVELLAEE